MRRAVARSIIPRLFTGGYSASAALNVFRKIGPGLRRKLWLSDWREITGAKKLERAYRFIPRKIRLSYALMAPTETYQRKKFKYVFDTEAKNLETGDIVKRTQSMESDVQLSIEEAERAWLEKIQDEISMCAWAGVMEPIDTTLRVVYRKLPVQLVTEQVAWIESGTLGPEWV